MRGGLKAELLEQLDKAVDEKISNLSSTEEGCTENMAGEGSIAKVHWKLMVPDEDSVAIEDIGYD